MNILLDHGTYPLLNMGDLAQLQNAVSTLRELRPGARVRVMTSSPKRLARFCPGAEAVDVHGRATWLTDRNLLGGLHRLVPHRSRRRVADFERAVLARWPDTAYPWVAARLHRRGKDTAGITRYLAAVGEADLVVASGGGYLTDTFALHARNLLHTLATAQHLGKPVVLLGQGVGPMKSPSLRRVTARVLKKARLVGLREGRAGPGVVAGLGVDPDRVRVTGDEAVGVGLSRVGSPPGTHLGLSIRDAGYAGLPDGFEAALRGVLRRLLARHRTQALTLPISLNENLEDQRALDALLEGLPRADESALPADSPPAVAARASQCRVVVSGTYHAAVFALSQGIPVVLLAGAAYYVDKQHGLTERFGPACRVLDLDRPDWEAGLEAAVDHAWQNADAARDDLIAAARRQQRDGRAAWEEALRLVPMTSPSSQDRPERLAPGSDREGISREYVPESEPLARGESAELRRMPIHEGL